MLNRLALLALCAVACGEDAGATTDAATGDAVTSVDAPTTTADAPLADPDAAPQVVTATNPVLGVDHPDPSVLRTTDGNGDLIYYLVATVGSAGDIPVYSSRDLLTWELASPGLFGRTSTPGSSLAIHGYHYCAIWAPQIVELGPSSFMLSFTAQRYATAQQPCPAYAEDSGVYLAWSASPTGPFADDDHPWEPLRAGGQLSTCPSATAEAIPHSLDVASQNCQGTYCSHIIRLDSEVFRDPSDGRWWLAYSWYTNRPPMVAWEQDNHGEHVSIVELDASDPFAVVCDVDVAQVFAGNPHHQATLTALAGYCPRCDEMLSMTRGRFGEELVFDGYSWGINEGAALFRRGGYVYLMMSGSAWDSGYYHVFWVAAPTVAELAYGNADRLAGRYLIPSLAQGFGHGQVVLGPDGTSHYMVHHRLRSNDCSGSGDCARDVWVSPVEFEDRGDGRGEVWITPRFPAENPSVSVTLP